MIQPRHKKHAADRRRLRPMAAISTSVGKATLGSLTAGAGTQLALALSGVLAARMLGPENRGYAALLVVIPSVIAQVGGLGLSLSLSYFIARNPDRERSIARAFLRPGLVQTLVLLTIHVVVIMIFIRG